MPTCPTLGSGVTLKALLSTSSPPLLPSRFTTTCFPYCSFRSTMCLQWQWVGSDTTAPRSRPATWSWAPQGRCAGRMMLSRPCHWPEVWKKGPGWGKRLLLSQHLCSVVLPPSPFACLHKRPRMGVTHRAVLAPLQSTTTRSSTEPKQEGTAKPAGSGQAFLCHILNIYGELLGETPIFILITSLIKVTL